MSDIALTMEVGRSILQKYFSLKENEHSSVFRELGNFIFIVIEYFLGSMQAITPTHVRYNVDYETYKAGCLYKHPTTFPR